MNPLAYVLFGLFLFFNFRMSPWGVTFPGATRSFSADCVSEGRLFQLAEISPYPPSATLTVDGWEGLYINSVNFAALKAATWMDYRIVYLGVPAEGGGFGRGSVALLTFADELPVPPYTILWDTEQL